MGSNFEDLGSEFEGLVDALFNRYAHSAGPFLNMVFSVVFDHFMAFRNTSFLAAFGHRDRNLNYRGDDLEPNALIRIQIKKKLVAHAPSHPFEIESVPKQEIGDPVEMRNLPVLQCFRHSLMILAAIPHQSNPYGAILFLLKILLGVEISRFCLEMCRSGNEACRSAGELCRSGFEICREWGVRVIIIIIVLLLLLSLSSLLSLLVVVLV